MILTVLAGSNVYDYLATQQLLPRLNVTTESPAAEATGLAAMIREAIEVQKDFRGFVWYQAFRQNLTQMGVFFAVLLGCGGLLHESSKGSALFTLSLPVTRKQLLGARTGDGTGAVLAISMVPPLAISILAPSDRPAVQPRRRARARRLHLLRRRRVLQPRGVSVDAVHRHLAADADRDRHRLRDGVRGVRGAADQHLQRDERRDLLQDRLAAVGRIPDQRSDSDGVAIQRCGNLERRDF